MTTPEQTKCAHLPCRCFAQAREEYCGQACKEACQCDHGMCPLTV